MAKFVLSAFADEAGESLAEQIDALKANGIDHIEPRNIDGRGILSFSNEEYTEIKKALDLAGIRVNSLGSPIGKYPITEPFEEHLEDLKKAINAAKLLGTRNIRMFSFFVPYESRAEHRAEVLRRMELMLDMAEENGIRLCHENESNIYGQMPEEVADLLDSLPRLYSIFDPANYRMNGADPIKGMDATLKRLAYLHIKDAEYATGTILPAGEGEGCIREAILKADEATDGTVYLTLEPHLHGFVAYKSIDTHELKGKYSFENGRQAFDYAANALKKLLTEIGFKRNGENEWTR